ncbi:MAG: hypothetical protein ACOYYS_14235 [Chloroflexota bacterium]
MSHTMPSHPSSRRSTIGAGGCALILLWASGVLLLALIAGYWAISAAHQSRAAAIQRHKDRVDPNATEAGKTAAEKSPPPGHENDIPIDVRVGLYVDRIVEISVKETGWTVDFYIWFNWDGDSIHPGENFQVVDGAIETKEKLKETVDGNHHYALYRVTARITKFFNVSRFPCDDHLLTISIEDQGLQSYQLRYVPDAGGSAISSRVKIPGYEIYDQTATVKPHSYKTPRGDPALPTDFKATYSQFIFGIWAQRPDFGFYFKMFQGLFAAVAISLLVFFIKPTDVDPRFGLSVGAFFAAIANTYVVASLLPDSGAMTLTDMVNGIGMGVIFLTLLQSTISLYLYDRRGMQALSGLFDRASFVILATVYLIINIAIPWVAIL